MILNGIGFTRSQGVKNIPNFTQNCYSKLSVMIVPLTMMDTLKYLLRKSPHFDQTLTKSNKFYVRDDYDNLVRLLAQDRTESLESVVESFKSIISFVEKEEQKIHEVHQYIQPFNVAGNFTYRPNKVTTVRRVFHSY